MAVHLPLLAVLSGALLQMCSAAIACLPPNNADQRLYHTECHIKRSRTLTINSVLSKSENGSTSYPLDFGKQVLIFEIAGRNTGTEVSRLLLDLELQQFIGLKPTACKWLTIPVGVFLRNIDAGLDAPIGRGDVVMPIKLTLDTTHPFLLIFSTGNYYALNAKLKDGSYEKARPVGCLRMEFKPVAYKIVHYRMIIHHSRCALH
uniref:Uncharacterized protein n=1 Tax=Trichuris muris TaxID=70415 RepID=A0A5S6QW77_TRIMR